MDIKFVSSETTDEINETLRSVGSLRAMQVSSHDFLLMFLYFIR